MSFEKQQQQFFKKYNISEDEFNEVGLIWSELIQIAENYLKFIPTLKAATSPLLTILQDHPDVHSVRTRVKDPEHLIEKIIRKTIDKKMDEEDSEYKVTVENYRTKITDLLGIRVLHLYKEQALNIDEKIRATWNLHEQAKIYSRKGDYTDQEKQELSERFDVEDHRAGYRSWHYLIESQITKEMIIAEIQVRTIFEEGWSEVDHQLRYPYHLDNVLLTKQLLVLNRLAGNADEMVNSIRETKKNLQELQEDRSKKEKIISDLNNELEGLKNELEAVYEKKEIQEGDLKSLREKIKSLEESQKKLRFNDKIMLGGSITHFNEDGSLGLLQKGSNITINNGSVISAKTILNSERVL
ncbi:hypothetical protein V7068_12220 [Bacillus sp. JJ634]